MFITLQIDTHEDRTMRFNIHPNSDIALKPQNSNGDICYLIWQNKQYTIHEPISKVEEKINKAIIVEQAAINAQLRKHLKDMFE